MCVLGRWVGGRETLLGVGGVIRCRDVVVTPSLFFYPPTHPPTHFSTGHEWDYAPSLLNYTREMLIHLPPLLNALALPLPASSSSPSTVSTPKQPILPLYSSRKEEAQPTELNQPTHPPIRSLAQLPIHITQSFLHLSPRASAASHSSSTHPFPLKQTASSPSPFHPCLRQQDRRQHGGRLPFPLAHRQQQPRHQQGRTQGKL